MCYYPIPTRPEVVLHFFPCIQTVAIDITLPTVCGRWLEAHAHARANTEKMEKVSRDCGSTVQARARDFKLFE